MKTFKNSQLYQLTYTVFLETVREPEVLFWGIVFPVLISIGLGLAFTQNAESKFRVMMVERHSTLDSLLDRHASRSRETYVWRVENKTLGNTEFTFVHSDWPSAIISLKRGEAEVILSDSAGELRYHFDPHNAQAQLVYMQLSALTNEASAEARPANIEPLILRGVRYIDFLVPGLMAFGLMSSMLCGISYTIIERRSQKLLRRMVATPMKKSNFLVALMFVRIVMNGLEALILFFFAWLLFDIRIQGNLGALCLLFLAGNLAFTGLSVLISSRTAKTEIGTGWINAVQMPMMILSGIFFSYHNFPEWSIGVIQLLPLTAVADGFRCILNEGGGWLEICKPSVTLSVFGLACFAVGMRLFKWH